MRELPHAVFYSVDFSRDFLSVHTEMRIPAGPQRGVQDGALLCDIDGATLEHVACTLAQGVGVGEFAEQGDNRGIQPLFAVIERDSGGAA